jgi:hypothetical protein
LHLLTQAVVVVVVVVVRHHQQHQWHCLLCCSAQSQWCSRELLQEMPLVVTRVV